IPLVARASFVRVHAGDTDGDVDYAADRMADGSLRLASPDPGLHDSFRRVVRFVVVSDAASVASLRSLSPTRSSRTRDFSCAARELDLAVVHGAPRIGAGGGDVRHGDWRRHLATGDAGADGSVRLAQRLCDLRRSGLVSRGSDAVVIAQR